jgi:hypothetical protein
MMPFAEPGPRTTLVGLAQRLTTAYAYNHSLAFSATGGNYAAVAQILAAICRSDPVLRLRHFVCCTA